MSHPFPFSPLSPKTPTKGSGASLNFFVSQSGHNKNKQRSCSQNDVFFHSSPSKMPSISPLCSPMFSPKKRIERPLSYLKSPEKAREHRRIANQQRIKDRIRNKNMENMENEYSQITYLNYISQLEKESQKHIISPEEAEKAALEIQQEKSQCHDQIFQNLNEADLFEASLNEELEVTEWPYFEEMDIDDDECLQL